MKIVKTFLRDKVSIRKCLPFVLLAVMFLVTGCPHNEYEVNLKPQGATIERTLTFYREDGVDAKTGKPNYRSFNPAELAAITNLYPAGSLTNEDDGQRHIIRAAFTGALPDDVGGAGSYTNYLTSLGSAAIYEERFRGNDDLAGMTERRFLAADQLADWLVGWSQQELGTERGYEHLHHFLDVDVRQGIKNMSQYWWEGRLVSNYQTNAGEEFAVRFGQYLMAHGYFSLTQIPLIFRAFSGGEMQPLMPQIQRLVAEKLGVPDNQPIPASLDFLKSEAAMEKSLDAYLAGTAAYRARLKHWNEQPDRKPDAKPPKPSDLVNDKLMDLFGFDFLGTPDHLTVRLALPTAPVRSNGRWDAKAKAVIWESDMEGRTNMCQLPVCCYASWAEPDSEFQLKHLGKVALSGDDLIQYCLWRAGLKSEEARQWDAFLADLQPGSELVHKVDAFRFTEAEHQSGTNAVPDGSELPRKLLKAAFK